MLTEQWNIFLVKEIWECINGFEHFEVAELAAAIFLVLYDDKQSCIINTPPSDGKGFVSAEAAASITLVWKKKGKKMFSSSPECFQD